MSAIIPIHLGVQASPSLPEILVGQLNEPGDTMLNPVDMTPEIVGAVAQFVIRHHNGELKGAAQGSDGSMIYFELVASAVPGSMPTTTEGVTP